MFWVAVCERLLDCILFPFNLIFLNFANEVLVFVHVKNCINLDTRLVYSFELDE